MAKDRMTMKEFLELPVTSDTILAYLAARQEDRKNPYREINILVNGS